MRWNQIAVAVAASSTGAYLAHSRGRTLLTAVLVGLVVYFVVRWVIAWLMRTRYWRARRGTRRRPCPDCGQRIYRLGGDWILTCRRCGWRAGWPVFRWLTRSVPVRQLRRTLAGPQLVIVVIALALLLSGASASVTPSDIPVPDGDAAESQESPPSLSATPSPTPDSVAPTTATAAPTPMETPTDTLGSDDGGMNITQVERAVFEAVNERRDSRGHAELNYDASVAADARDHARDMAAKGYFNHTSPSGETQQTRYGCTSGENIYQTWVDRDVITLDDIRHHTTEDSLATGIFKGWVNSPLHYRLGILGDWSRAGVGVAITESGKVYAVMGFCR